MTVQFSTSSNDSLKINCLKFSPYTYPLNHKISRDIWVNISFCFVFIYFVDSILITNGHYDTSQPWQELPGASKICFPDCPSLAVYGVGEDENVHHYKLTIENSSMPKFGDKSYQRPVFISIQDKGIKSLSKIHSEI